MKYVSYRDTSGTGTRIYFLIPAIIVCALAVFINFFDTAVGQTSEDGDPVLLDVHTLYNDYSSTHPDIPDITVEEYLSLREERTVLLVDDRTSTERSVSMIPGAMSVEEFEAVWKDYRGTPIVISNPVVVYCTIGVRSGRYTKKLIRRGFVAYNLAGGVLAWAHAGGEFVDPRGNRTDTVHVYGEDWNLLPPGYTPVW